MLVRGTPVTYKGVDLKSKHERAWARYWDRRGLAWTYEPTRFCLERESYLPDFLVGPTYNEIKAYGAKNLNKFHLCNEKLLVIFGLPERCYIHFKPAGSSRFLPTHFTDWERAYEKACS